MSRAAWTVLIVGIVVAFPIGLLAWMVSPTVAMMVTSGMWVLGVSTGLAIAEFGHLRTSAMGEERRP